MRIGIRTISTGAANSRIRHSRLYNFDKNNAAEDTVAIKYVLKGEERYQADGTEYAVTPGKLLVINTGTDYICQLQEKLFNEGLCIFIGRQLLNEVHCNMIYADHKLLDHHYTLDYRPEIVAGMYADNEDGLGTILQSLGCLIQSETTDEATNTNAIFYQIAQSLLVSQQQVERKIQQVKARKPAVQKELYQRMQLAKCFMLDNLQKDIGIEDIAATVQMSCFHFMRVFRQVENQSAYQYLVHKRLELSISLIRQKIYTITEVAGICGFADVFSFSKAFKRKYSCSPSAVL